MEEISGVKRRSEKKSVSIFIEFKNQKSENEDNQSNLETKRKGKIHLRQLTAQEK